jgi:hypothetical protein
LMQVVILCTRGHAGLPLGFWRVAVKGEQSR